MGFSAKVGSFNLGTGIATSTKSVSGVGFQPKVVLFWWSGRTESVDTTNGSIDIKGGFGAMVSGTERGASAFYMDDANSISDTNGVIRNDACIATTSGALATDGLADFSSMDADGFTVIIDDAFSTDIRVSYLALGGTDLTNVTVNTFDIATSGASQNVTSAGFQPDAVFLSGVSSAYNTVGNQISFYLGVAAGATPTNNLTVFRSEDNSGNTQNKSYALSGSSVGMIASGLTTTLDHEASVSAWLSNGFTLSVPNLPSFTTKNIYVALKGGSYYANELLTQTDTTTDIAKSGFGFTPSAAFFLSACRAESTAATASDGVDLSMGAFDSTSSRCAQGVQEEHNTAVAEDAASLELDEVYTNISTADAVEGLMDIKSVDADGFTCIMDDADPSQSWVGFIAMGPTVVASTAVRDIIGCNMIIPYAR